MHGSLRMRLVTNALAVAAVALGAATAAAQQVTKDPPTGQGRMDQQSMGQPPVARQMGQGPMSQGQLTQMMRDWHPAAQEAVRMMTQKYGPPMEMTATMAMWGKTGPWKRTIVSSQAVQHAFPMPHPDVMEQVVDYRVPPEMFDELAMYDGSVIVERTKGELSARCDKEAANLLALNLAHEIVTGKQTVEGARKMYGEQIMAMKAGRPAPYTERLMFEPMPNAADPDQPLPMAGAPTSPP